MGDVVWACILIPLGRLFLVLDRAGNPTAAIVGGLIGFVYLFGVGLLGLSGSLGYDTFPHPFDEGMVNIIFSFGAGYIAFIGYLSKRRSRHGGLTFDIREQMEARRAAVARRMSTILGPILVVLALVIPIVIPFTPWSSA